MSGTYPTEEELEVIRTWKWSDDLRPLFEYIKERWSYADWGWFEKEGRPEEWANCTNKVRVYKISTAGWSGNEDIINALSRNIVWSQVFYVHRTGGHFVFKVSYDRKEKPEQ